MAFNVFLEHVYEKHMVKYARKNNNSHIFLTTYHAGLSYLEIVRERLRWAQLGLIQNVQALATVEKKT